MNVGSALAVTLVIGASTLAGCVSVKQIQEDSVKNFSEALVRRQMPFAVPPATKLDTVIVDTSRRQIVVRMSKEFSYVPFRSDNVRRIYAAVDSSFREGYPGYSYSVQTLGQPIEQLIPNYYRPSRAVFDVARIPRPDSARPSPVVVNASKPFTPAAGLYGKNIGLWHSHGWYYEKSDDRWMWQRPRLFQSVEDLGPMTFTIPYLIPMLENAGAMVFLPRERDTQRHEVVVDNDAPGPSYREISSQSPSGWKPGDGHGFAIGNPPYTGTFNPFRAGTHRVTLTDNVASSTASWIPDIPEEGFYAVYISYVSSPQNASDCRYAVYHDGGKTEFIVNQQIGGSTWQYLGTFKFRKGTQPERGEVVLANESAHPDMIVSADAVRFGGGMGNIARNGSASGRARYLEGARYYLQYAGMQDTLVYNMNADSSDYKDDYQSRAEYLNYLRGAPYGPNKNRSIKGLGIPIDLSLAFHTDAGITHNDTTVGTLSIYSIEAKDSTRIFPDSVSRLANRDLADLVQTQIVDDIRALYDPAWNRRELRNADYSEATRPNFPGMLLELLSHQNFLDMKFMLDPGFRFDVSRAIYKGMLRFLSAEYDTPYVVQPLPITHFAAELTPDGGARLQWRPCPDPLEPSATPERYCVYTRVNDGGFDNGRLVEGTDVTLHDLRPGTIYSYYVTALNSGGESFPAEILSVGRLDNDKPTILVVNGFTRVSGPTTVETPTFAGFLDPLDAGVPDRSMLNFSGEQYDYDPSSPFRTNDAPGHGASHADHEGSVIAGNTFDFPCVHGGALLEAGFPFASCSKAAVMDSIVTLQGYRCVDLILGEERETPRQRATLDSLRGPRFAAFPPKLQSALRQFTAGGGNILVSGAYVGADLHTHMPQDSSAARFGNSILRFKWVTGQASRTGQVVPTKAGFLPDTLTIRFNTRLRPDIYAVESPDAIMPVGGASTILRYAENLYSAGISYKGRYKAVVLGFPFETVVDPGSRLNLMKAVLGFFGM